ncbi:MAG: lysophospholipid acyltransferase family protein [Bradymonadia bacterium]
MQLPSKTLLKSLDPQARALYVLGALANEYPISKRLNGYFHRFFTDYWITAAAEREFIGEHNLPRDRAVLMVCNHRTFFDYYLVASRMMKTWSPAPKIYFPVRSKFFYEKPLGGVVNATMSGYSMYPPIYRKDSKGLDAESRKALNRYAVGRCVEILNGDQPAIIGFHPEGRRNESEDPYDLLPPKPGAGEIAHRARAAVVPVFIANVDSSFTEQVKKRFKPNAGPVRIRFGEPLDLDDLYDQHVDDHLTKSPVFDAILDEMMLGIRTLAEADRAEYAPDHPPLDLSRPEREDTPPEADTAENP